MLRKKKAQSPWMKSPWMKIPWMKPMEDELTFEGVFDCIRASDSTRFPMPLTQTIYGKGAFT